MPWCDHQSQWEQGRENIPIVDSLFISLSLKVKCRDMPEIREFITDLSHQQKIGEDDIRIAKQVSSSLLPIHLFISISILVLSCDYWQRDKLPSRTSLNAVVFDILSNLVFAFFEVDCIVWVVVVLIEQAINMIWYGSTSDKGQDMSQVARQCVTQARTWPRTWLYSQVEQR